MLTADQLKIVLGSADHRRTYGLELPDASLTALADPAQFSTFYERWTAQGQPRYVPAAAAAPAAVASASPVPPAAPAPVAVMPTPVPPAPLAPATVAPTTFAPAYQPTPDPYAPAAFNSSSYDPTAPYSSPNMVHTPAVGARPGLGGMALGFGTAAVGGIITFVTWEFAAPGGTFVVAWGAIIFGLIRGVRGAITYFRG